jgi:16S rRNA (cytidine1402-2'-O)-methyltransferase
MRGTLFVVATPIGNLEDLSPRAARVMAEVAVVAAEDTRHTARLLRHLQITAQTVSFHEHNERQRIPALVGRLLAGEHVALVSDAGTPGVSAPGFRLVRAAIDAGIRVEPVPGPSALVAALVVSGLPTDRFVFEGFSPARQSARRAWLDRLADEPRTIIYYEAPHRLRESLEDLRDRLGDRPVAVARELTKVHEEVLRGTVAEVLGEWKRISVDALLDAE